MKLSKKDVGVFSVTISQKKGNSGRVAPEVSRMLRLALEEAGAANGAFAYQVTGKCQGMYASGTFMMTVGTYSLSQRRISISAKYAPTAERTVTGYLVVPKGHDIPLVYTRLCEATARLNQEKWARLPMKGEKGRKAHKVSVPEVGDTIPKLRVIQGGVQNVVPQKKAPPAPVSTAQVVPLEESQFAALLMGVYRLSTNATFMSKDLTASLREAYPERDQRGLATGTVSKFRRRGWIRQVQSDAGNCWQIEETFLRLQGIADKITQLPALGKAVMSEQAIAQKVAKPIGKLSAEALREVATIERLTMERNQLIGEIEQKAMELSAKSKELKAVQAAIACCVKKASPEVLAKAHK